jgi:hypothetical protein
MGGQRLLQMESQGAVVPGAASGYTGDAVHLLYTKVHPAQDQGYALIMAPWLSQTELGRFSRPPVDKMRGRFSSTWCQAAMLQLSRAE